MNSTEPSTKEVVGLVLLVPISKIKVKFFSIINLYNKMSDYQRPSNGVVPKLVSDVNLKRARVETENGDAIQTTISGIDSDNPLPVLVKSDSTQWYLRGYSGSSAHYHRLQWFYVSPQPLLTSINYGNTRWVTVVKLSSDDSYGRSAADLTKDPVYRFSSTNNDNTFPGGWIAGYSDTYLSSLTLLGYKAGNTDFASPDIEVLTGGRFLWGGEDFMGCQQIFNSATLYMQKVGGTQSDAAWGGSGDGSVISLLKGIANIF